MTNLLNILSAEPLRLALALFVIMSFVGLNAAYLVWVERKGAGRFQRRPGPTEVGYAGLLQPIADALKLMSKQLIVPDGRGRDAVPGRAAAGDGAGVDEPGGHSLQREAVGRDINVGLLMIFALGSINVMAIMLGGWSSRNKYAIISAARVVSQNVAYEIPMLLVVITMIMVTGTMDLNEIVRQQAGGFWQWNLFRWDVNPLAPVTFLIFTSACWRRPTAPRSTWRRRRASWWRGLTRSIRGWGLACFSWRSTRISCSDAAWRRCCSWAAGRSLRDGGIWSGLFWFLAKMYFLVFSVVWIRWTFPRTQFYGLLNLSWKILIPVSLFTLILTSAMMKIFQVFTAYEERTQRNRQRIQQPVHGHENHDGPVLQALGDGPVSA